MRLSDLPTLRFMAADRTIETLDLAASGAEVATRAAWLGSHVPAGAAVGLALRSEPRLALVWLAALAAGLRPLILQYPTAKQTRDYWRSSVLHTAELVGLAAVVGDARVAGLLEGSGVAVLDPDARTPGDHAAVDTLPRFSILQLSSGTTGHRKAVEFTDAQLERHVRDFNARLGLDRARDHIVSWLPLYHDMGYVACFVMPLLLGVPVTTIDPETWVADKPILFDAIEAVRGTHCYMPNFGFETLAQPTGRDLSSMRRWISCSEPVLAATARRFLAATGADPATFSACYAMAENVFAVSLSDGLVEFGGVVSCGPPIPGVEVKTVDGELWVRSPASIERYVGGDDIRDADGFYPTGDLGAVIDGEVHVAGRRRDVLIQAGRKFLLSAIDAAVNELLPATKGRAAAVALGDARLGTEKPAVLIEIPDFFRRTDHRAVADAVAAATGLDFLDVHFVPPRFLTKTSSGKINRALSAKHWSERERAVAATARQDPAAELDRLFGSLPADVPVGEGLDSLSLTLLRIILADAGAAYRPEATLGDLRAALAGASPPSPKGARPLRIVSLADRRGFHWLTEGDLLAFSQRLGLPVSFEHLCLPPSPVLLSDLVFLDYFGARLDAPERLSAVAAAAAKLRAADVILVDDVAEFHFPVNQIYPVLSHRLERSGDADLLAFRWQRYVERHDELPVVVAPGKELPLGGREITLDALSRYLGVPFFRMASVQVFAPFTQDWEYRPLLSTSGGPGLEFYDPAELLSALGDWIAWRQMSGLIRVPPGPSAVTRFDMTDLAHFCSHAVDRAGADQVLAAYNSFCIVGQPASAPYVRRTLAAMGKPWCEAPSYDPAVLARMPPFECLLSCGPTARIDTDRPAVAIMAAHWPSVALNTALPPDLQLRGALPAADTGEWFNLGGTGPALTPEQLMAFREANLRAQADLDRRRAARKASADDPFDFEEGEL